MMGLYLLGIIIMVISMIVSSVLKSKFEKYSRTRISSNLTGKEIAEKMLHDHGIYDVKVVSVEGTLTDHYNPKDKTVNLSAMVYHERSAAAAAVSAHECGHAVQHATAYSMLQLRSSLVPMVSIASKYMQWVILGGILILSFTGNPTILAIGTVFFAATTLFAFVTLPVEFDASARALRWIKDKNIVNDAEYADSKDALKWAAMTYVVAAIGSLATLLYYVSLLSGRRN